VPLFERLFAAGYDRTLAGAERAGLARRRRELLGDLGGHVVELGAGTGLNLVAYGPEVTRLTLLEPSTPMADRLRARLDEAPRDAEVEVLGAPAEALPLPDDSADVVVSTLVLCTVGDLDRTLAEIERVLRPEGRLVLLEHVVADDPGTRRLQRVLRRPWAVVGGGCQLDRDPRAALIARGWDVTDLHDERLPMPPPTRPGQVGTATR
jgi:ubiquinone/menaquinone biosynthesis C-methylase UbiE